MEIIKQTPDFTVTFEQIVKILRNITFHHNFRVILIELLSSNFSLSHPGEKNLNSTNLIANKRTTSKVNSATRNEAVVFCFNVELPCADSLSERDRWSRRKQQENSVLEACLSCHSKRSMLPISTPDTPGAGMNWSSKPCYPQQDHSINQYSEMRF